MRRRNTVLSQAKFMDKPNWRMRRIYSMQWLSLDIKQSSQLVCIIGQMLVRNYRGLVCYGKIIFECLFSSWFCINCIILYKYLKCRWNQHHHGEDFTCFKYLGYDVQVLSLCTSYSLLWIYPHPYPPLGRRHILILRRRGIWWYFNISVYFYILVNKAKYMC